MLTSELCSQVPVYSATMHNELLEGINNSWKDEALLHRNRLGNFLVSKTSVFLPIMRCGFVHSSHFNCFNWLDPPLSGKEDWRILREDLPEEYEKLNFWERSWSFTNWILHLQNRTQGYSRREITDQYHKKAHYCIDAL